MKIDTRSMPKQIQATSLKIHVKSMKSMTDPLEPLQIHDIDAKIQALYERSNMEKVYKDDAFLLCWGRTHKEVLKSQIQHQNGRRSCCHFSPLNFEVVRRQTHRGALATSADCVADCLFNIQVEVVAKFIWLCFVGAFVSDSDSVHAVRANFVVHKLVEEVA